MRALRVAVVIALRPCPAHRCRRHPRPGKNHHRHTRSSALDTSIRRIRSAPLRAAPAEPRVRGMIAPLVPAEEQTREGASGSGPRLRRVVGIARSRTSSLPRNGGTQQTLPWALQEERYDEILVHGSMRARVDVHRGRCFRRSLEGMKAAMAGGGGAADGGVRATRRDGHSPVRLGQ